jgi:stage III sporulation protein AH
MMVFKRKQIVILALILMIVVAGYLQYSYKQGSTSADKETAKLGDAVYVDNQIENQGIAGTDNEAANNVKSQANVSASKMANDFFAQAKMDKEQSLGKSNESLKAITEDVNASKETRNKAYEEMMAIVDRADKEMRIETLINKMGFNDSVALFADDGSIDIVVKTPSLTNAQTAQITDIVARQGKLTVDNIHIRKLF